MANTLPKFPWRVDDGNALMEPVKGDQDEKRKNVFLQSACIGYVDNIFARIKCVCSGPFSGVNVADYPRVAPCGHYKHQRCKHVFNTGEQQYYGPCVLNCKVVYNDQYGGITDVTDLPIAATLKEFFSDMIDPGYKCMECNDHHPLSNSIRVLKDENKIDEPVGTYACVWCATKSKTNLDDSPLISENCTVRFIDIKQDEVSPREERIRLKSLDRKSKIVPCIIQCCACGKSLRKTDPYENSLLKIVDVMPCEHYRHNPSLPNAVACSEIVCNMCGVQGPTGGQERFVRIEDYLSAYLNKCERAEARICSLCDELHPRENMIETLAGRTCRWCAVEDKFYSFRRNKRKN